MSTPQETEEAARAAARSEHSAKVLASLAEAKLRSADLSKYVASNVDDAGSPKYYGYQNGAGLWYIMKEASNVFTYARGDSDYSTAWTGRASLTYAVFSEVF